MRANVVWRWRLLVPAIEHLCDATIATSRERVELLLLLLRAFAFLCCRKEPELSPNDPKQKEQRSQRQNKQEFEGTFVTEAKDWAGELISGQTTTGRILFIQSVAIHGGCAEREAHLPTPISLSEQLFLSMCMMRATGNRV
ncbi:hypothetical protein B566_EDAN007633 [Ephemera danica]|nr:hypothetical protein B566_EDAN007633 [Ephemera danica]